MKHCCRQHGPRPHFVPPARACARYLGHSAASSRSRFSSVFCDRCASLCQFSTRTFSNCADRARTQVSSKACGHSQRTSAHSARMRLSSNDAAGESKAKQASAKRTHMLNVLVEQDRGAVKVLLLHALGEEREPERPQDSAMSEQSQTKRSRSRKVDASERCSQGTRHHEEAAGKQEKGKNTHCENCCTSSQTTERDER